MNIEEISQLINSDSFNTDDLSPDAVVLFKVVKELLPMFKENAELYSDMRSKFVKYYLSQPKLKIEQSFLFETSNESSHKKLKQQIIQLAKQLNQYKEQSYNTREQSKNTILQLNKEIDDLKQQVKSYENIIDNIQNSNNQLDSEQDLDEAIFEEDKKDS